ncbi:15316_t:CDS:10 [Entrophospora sp. SA101]|nr:1625_t:CDS:10 [Entrophospora sp. SA101]CAJ0909647.1 15316_t:CDS:10 [Entrophospora sp. SA101]
MKFAKVLQSDSVPEWKSKYIDYKKLKKLLGRIKRTSSKGRLGIIEGSLAQSSSSSLKKKTSLIIDNGKSPLEQPPMQSIQPQSSSLSSPKKKLKLITNDFPSPIMQSPIQTYPASTSKRKLNFITEKEVCFESPTETLRKLQQFPLRQDKSMQQNLRSRPSYNYGLIRKFSDMIAPTKRTSNDFLTKEEQDFFLALEEELLKICEFYEIKEKETLNRWETLKECYQDIQEQIKKASKQRKQEAKCKRAVKKAILEFYRGVELLRNYQVLNKTGFAKILKKYDKISSLNGTEVYMPRVISCNFSKSNVVNDLIKEAENFYIDKFEGGLRRQAMKKLRLPNKQTTYHSVSSRVGMNIGLSIPILFKSLVLAKSNSNEYDDDTLSKLLLIYSGFFLIIIFALLIGTNMFVWERSKINYKFIFEFDPRNNLDFKEYLELPSLMLLLLSLAMYATFSSDVKFIHQENFVWILTVSRILGSFFFRVEFRDFFIADELNSITYSLSNLLLLITIKIPNPQTSIYFALIGVAAPWFRFLQCLRRYKDTRQPFPHFVNSLKYFTTIISIILSFAYRLTKNNSDYSSLKYLYIFSQVISSTYGFLWDIKMDWSLFDINSALAMEFLSCGK